MHWQAGRTAETDKGVMGSRSSSKTNSSAEALNYRESSLSPIDGTQNEVRQMLPQVIQQYTVAAHIPRTDSCLSQVLIFHATPVASAPNTPVC